LAAIENKKKGMSNDDIDDDKEWTICCSKSNKECIKYGTQITIASFVLIFSASQLALGSDDKEIYFSLISFVLGLIFPHPSLENH
jgi:hypothetical protein